MIAWLIGQRGRSNRRRLLTITSIGTIVICGSCSTTDQIARDDLKLELIVQHVPGTVESLHMVPVHHEGVTFWISRTEITWDLYDVFVYGKDEHDPQDADAVTRPTQPYIALDRGFGRNGYPAISMSFRNAQQFCVWLSQRTGKNFQLPKLSQWQAACGVDSAMNLDEHAWHAGNADRTTHPVGRKLANIHGLHDMLGNVAEWCMNDAGEGIVVGGSFRDAADAISCNRTQTPTDAWNASDPQFPPSVWWLADAPFVGLRVVLVDE